MEEKFGVVATVTGATSDDLLAPVQLEMLMLPLASQSHAEARVLGALAPMAAPIGSAPRRSARSRSACSVTSAARPTYRRRASRLRPDGSSTASRSMTVAGRCRPFLSVMWDRAAPSGIRLRD